MEQITYFGVIAKIINPDTYVIEVDIPGENERILAFPKRADVDEPRVGDTVLVTEYDPLYHTYYIYEKLKENDFIGFRARGKIIWITPKEMWIGLLGLDNNNCVYSEKRLPFTFKGDEWYDDCSGASMINEDYITSWIRINYKGDLDVFMERYGHIHITDDHSVELDANCDVKIKGNTTIKIDGNADIKVGGTANVNVGASATVNSPVVTITGGMLKVEGQVAPNPASGPFCGIPNCLITGAPHRGNIVMGT